MDLQPAARHGGVLADRIVLGLPVPRQFIIIVEQTLEDLTLWIMVAGEPMILKIVVAHLNI